jgi:hypothetical protein
MSRQRNWLSVGDKLRDGTRHSSMISSIEPEVQLTYLHAHGLDLRLTTVAFLYAVNTLVRMTTCVFSENGLSTVFF